MVDGALRIDKFLWHARLARSRSIAHDVVEAGHIRVGGRRIDRAHALVRVGDVLSVPVGNSVRVVRIESLPPRRVSPRDVPAVYTDLSPREGQLY